ncbi:aminotransferase [Jhaorihella thermophila]|uniref:aspartate transaminase n=1 Tax=Jhaorihella thermophila TaxID=488547 RepID=A0A1H5RTG6_9RHOB|nr:aminotransferase [Jhaorihella thermophila]SEF41394.1 Aspartate/methionine/tyrosine aminotransferase [Jhaorihella thermophila]
MAPRTAATFAPPIPQARKWLDGVTFSPERPLINVSQAAPVDPPPRALRQAMADYALNEDAAHLYGPVLGMPELRAALAEDISRHYGGSVAAAQVAITSGCNEAFAAVTMAIAGQGDEIILPTPWYFNHKMWLDMAGIRAVPLPVGPDMLPDPDRAARLVTDRTRAIALVTPNNPCGVEYPAELVQAFRDLARSRGIRLIVDETYRDFDSRSGPPHDLFADPAWDEVFVHLYSFSKTYRLTGHRIGALAASPALLEEAEKFLDTVTICPSQIGQFGALWGLRNLGQWVAGERADILDRRAAISDGFGGLQARGWRLLGLGAYFAYVEHPFDMSADELARRLVREAGVLLLPATMFVPEGDPTGARQLRIAFANIDRAGIGALFDRLSALSF